MLGVGRFGPRGRDADPGVGGPGAAGAGGAAAVDGGSGSGDGAPAEAPQPFRVDDAERDAWVILNEVTDVGPVTFGRLVSRCGSAGAVLAESLAPGGVARLVDASTDVDGSSPLLLPATARSIAEAALRPSITLGPVRRSGVGVLVLADAAYPSRLRRTALPPPVLYVRGSVAAMDRQRAVALVGTRRPTAVGRGTAARIADAVAGFGATVVSGLALGIDAAAHVTAVDAGRPTVAVIGGGHDRLYPASHRGLVRRIVDTGGAVVSEFAPDTQPTRGTFPRRNRVISGLSDATVVVEAGARSGALTTAAWALEQGRGLFIVPGRLDDPAVAGSLAFLREAGPNAVIVVGIPELLEDLGFLGGLGILAHPSGPGAAPRRRPRPPSPEAVLAVLPAVERAVAREVMTGRTSIDEMVAATGLGGATVIGALTALEIRGLVLETFGRYRAAGPLSVGPARSAVPDVGGRSRRAAATDEDRVA